MANDQLEPVTGKYSKSLAVTATFIEGAGKSKNGAWAVGCTYDGAVFHEETAQDIPSEPRFTYFYNADKWHPRIDNAMFFEDFDIMLQYLSKRKIVCTSQNCIEVKEAAGMKLLFFKGKAQIVEGDLDTYLQVNYRLTELRYNSIKFLKTAKH